MRASIYFSEQHAEPRERGGDEREHGDAYELALAVETEAVIALAALRFGIEVLEEMRFRQQQPVEEDVSSFLIIIPCLCLAKASFPWLAMSNSCLKRKATSVSHR